MSDAPVVLVTGATSGIGAATAVALGAQGWRVAVHGRDVARGREVAERVEAAGGQAVVVVADLRDEAAVDAAVDEVVGVWGRLDHAFNNAGVLGPGSVADATVDDFDHAFSVNTRALWLCMRAEVRHLRATGGGAIVNNLSVHSLRAVFPGVTPYVASKAAALALTRCAAVELAPEGIRVNGVAPGPTQTELFLRSREEWGGDDPWTPLIPLGRVGTTDEVADVVSWLFSDGARYVTGSVVPVDGGFLAS